MWKKAKRFLAVLLALTLMLSVVDSEELFVSASATNVQEDTGAGGETEPAAGEETKSTDVSVEEDTAVTSVGDEGSGEDTATVPGDGTGTGTETGGAADATGTDGTETAGTGTETSGSGTEGAEGTTVPGSETPVSGTEGTEGAAGTGDATAGESGETEGDVTDGTTEAADDGTDGTTTAPGTVTDGNGSEGTGTETETGENGTDGTEDGNVTTDGADDGTDAADEGENPEAAAGENTDEAEETENVLEYQPVEQPEGVTIKAYAAEGVFPEDVTMTAAALAADDEETADQYQEAADALDSSEVSYDGFLAYDITFLDTDWNEIEPADGAVQVTFELDASLLPEEADTESLSVQHLEETEDGVEVRTVADTADAAEGTVEVKEEEAVVTAEFQVDGFSTFTITWNATHNNETPKFEAVCYFDNVADPNLGPDIDDELILGTNNELRFNDENELLAVDGYRLEYATMTYEVQQRERRQYGPFWGQWGNWSTFSSEIDKNIFSFTATYDWNNSQYAYKYKIEENGNSIEIPFIPESSENRTQRQQQISVSFKLYYTSVTETPQGDLVINDTIAENGSLSAVWEGDTPLGENVYYRWYRTAPDGSEEELASGEIDNTVEVYIDGARYTYRVEVWELNGEQAIATSNPYQVPYYNELQNGSFEAPKVEDDSSNTQFTNGLYPEMVWKTTGLGEYNTDKGTDGQDIEIINADNKDTGGNYGVITTADGLEQYAELNCETAGTLYQDVLTIPEIDLYWKASHRARTAGVEGLNQNSQDTMCVIIMDAEIAEQYVVNQSDVNQIYDTARQNGLGTGEDGSVTFTMNFRGSSTSVTVWRLTSDGTQWHDYESTYSVPEGQYLTRFLFGAVSTASNDITIGNLLDDVGFSQTPPIRDDSGNLQIIKNVDGMNLEEVIPQGTFDITVKNVVDDAVVATFSLPTTDARPGQSNAWNYWVSGLEEGIYQVIEDTPSEILQGYQYVSTTYCINNDETIGGCETDNFSVENGENVRVSFTNNYMQTEQTLIVSKEVSGSMGESSKDFSFSLQIMGSGTSPYTKEVSYVKNLSDGTQSSDVWQGNVDGNHVFSLKHGESIEIQVPTGADCVITESDYSTDYYTTTIRVEGTETENRTYTVQDINSETRLDFVNERIASAPTGVDSGSASWLWMIPFSLSTVLLFFGHKRRV